jgi:MoaA/NifB/PqqE/SkfB family radical SAM enzyme
MTLTIHYRGPLSSCNYDCDYCPFGKAWEAPDVLEADRIGLERFVAWAATSPRRLEILFTPWGEALVRPWYREALVALSQLDTVDEVAAQTNLSMPLDWLADADRGSTALWTTWHPSQVSMERFLRQCATLDRLGIAHSVGVVGLREHFDALAELRRRLPATTYLWVNAFQRVPGYYTDAERAWLASVDPNFGHNRPWVSRGRACGAGERHLTVDGDGTVRRCHFIAAPLGNLYADPLDTLLAPRPCTNDSCRCHIGYTHLDEAGQRAIYGRGLMARIPRRHLAQQRKSEKPAP